VTLIEPNARMIFA